MDRILAALISVTVGGALGFFVNRLSMSPLFRGIAAMTSGWVLASIITTCLWLVHAVEYDGIGGMSIGLSEILINTSFVVGAGAVVYFLLGAIGSTMLPFLLTSRTIVMGMLGGLAGSLVAVPHLPVGLS